MNLADLDAEPEPQDDAVAFKACKQMWASVMWQALVDAVRLSVAVRPIARFWHQDALEWFADDADGVGSFCWICDLMGLDPERVRQGVERMIEEAKRNGGKTTRWLVIDHG